MVTSLQYAFESPGNYTASTTVNIKNVNGTERFVTYSLQEFTVPEK